MLLLSFSQGADCNVNFQLYLKSIDSEKNRLKNRNESNSIKKTHNIQQHCARNFRVSFVTLKNLAVRFDLSGIQFRMCILWTRIQEFYTRIIYTNAFAASVGTKYAHVYGLEDSFIHLYYLHLNIILAFILQIVLERTVEKKNKNKGLARKVGLLRRKAFCKHSSIFYEYGCGCV